MAAARAKYAADPALTVKIRAEAIAKLPIPLPLTPESLDFNERLDRATVKSSALIAEAQAQLAAPVSDFLPGELTPSEVAEQKRAETWMQGYKLANETTDRILESNQKLFEDVMGAIAQMQADGIPVPNDYALPPPPDTKRTTVTSATTEGREFKATNLNSLYDGLPIEECICFNRLSSRQTRRPQPLLFETTGDLGDRTRLPADSKRVARRGKKVRAEKVVFAFDVSFAWVKGFCDADW
ncbi:hypothetical protein B0A55_03954 [Friedmanniomyces simplex]|uniref:Uncharacterized protein n=1 Tax=Friedmanniomyces simplex TaxID=329884 RepID=A0A4U0XTY6_9PEZI|nr:hypothetical protein B0A55_03954 [Friedmanniomyces simplex]